MSFTIDVLASDGSAALWVPATLSSGFMVLTRGLSPSNANFVAEHTRQQTAKPSAAAFL